MVSYRHHGENEATYFSRMQLPVFGNDAVDARADSAHVLAVGFSITRNEAD
jgi:hypothetical protein